MKIANRKIETMNIAMRILPIIFIALFPVPKLFGAGRVIIKYKDGVITTDNLMFPGKLRGKLDPKAVFKTCRNWLFKQLHRRKPGKGDEKELARVEEIQKRLNLRMSCGLIIDKYLTKKYMNEMITPEVDKKILENKRKMAKLMGLDKEVAAINYVKDFTSEKFTKKQKEAYEKFLPQNKYSLKSWKWLCKPKHERLRKWKLDEYSKLKSGELTKREKEYYFTSHASKFFLRLAAQKDRKARAYLKLGIRDMDYESKIYDRYRIEAAKELGFKVIDSRFGTLEEIITYNPFKNLRRRQ
ncbi:MAG: hypothetical protein GXP32_08855 [Kiritimatiellaeota bacterium]|nr:hypothetical protein [Kiritimatiellota bacterium]